MDTFPIILILGQNLYNFFIYYNVLPLSPLILKKQMLLYIIIIISDCGVSYNSNWGRTQCRVATIISSSPHKRWAYKGIQSLTATMFQSIIYNWMCIFCILYTQHVTQHVLRRQEVALGLISNTLYRLACRIH